MDKPWPTVDDVAARLRVPLSGFTALERDQLDAHLAAAIDRARQVPDWRTATDVPPRVWSAVVGLAALDYWTANPTTAVGDPDAAPSNPPSARWQYLLAMGHGRGGKPRVR